MRDGWKQVRPDDDLVACPMADGGEGTIDVVKAARPDAVLHTMEVADARGIASQAEWLMLDGDVAVIEAAQACGLSQLSAAQRNPLALTTYGVGQMVTGAVEASAKTVIVGLGGSATVDGGAGAMAALGHELRRADGNRLKVGGESLVQLDAVRVGASAGYELIAAIDVTNPLLGSLGAAPVFGPQKGASAQDVETLTRGLERWADVVERDLEGGPWRDLPGAGAAGGLGFALAAFLGAELRPGAAVVAELVGLEAALAGASIVVTGEGTLDMQTGAGKAPEYVRARASAVGCATAVVAGRIQDDAGARFDHALALGPDGLTRAAALVHQRSGELAATISK